MTPPHTRSGGPTAPANEPAAEPIWRSGWAARTDLPGRTDPPPDTQKEVPPDLQEGLTRMRELVGPGPSPVLLSHADSEEIRKLLSDMVG